MTLNTAVLRNSFFKSQFQDSFLAEGFKSLKTEAECLDISMEGVAKLFVDLSNGKSPGPDRIRKPDWLVDLSTPSNALALIYNASIKTCKLPKQ